MNLKTLNKKLMDSSKLNNTDDKNSSQNLEIQEILFEIIHPNTYQKIEELLNDQIGRDDLFRNEAKKLQGMVISVAITNPRLELYFVFLENEIRLKERSKLPDIEPDAKIEGDINAIFAFVTSDNLTDTFLNNLIEFEGLPLIMQDFYSWIRLVNVQWQEAMTDMLGQTKGMIAYLMAKTLMQKSKENTLSLRKKIADFKGVFREKVALYVSETHEQYIIALLNAKVMNIKGIAYSALTKMRSYKEKRIDANKIPLELKNDAPWQKERGLKDFEFLVKKNFKSFKKNIYR